MPRRSPAGRRRVLNRPVKFPHVARHVRRRSGGRRWKRKSPTLSPNRPVISPLSHSLPFINSLPILPVPNRPALNRLAKYPSLSFVAVPKFAATLPLPIVLTQSHARRSREARRLGPEPLPRTQPHRATASRDRKARVKMTRAMGIETSDHNSANC